MIGPLPGIQGHIPDRAVIALVCCTSIGDQDVNGTKAASIGLREDGLDGLFIRDVTAEDVEMRILVWA